jgi:hypothetical protein
MLAVLVANHALRPPGKRETKQSNYYEGTAHSGIWTSNSIGAFTIFVTAYENEQMPTKEKQKEAD